MRASSLVLIIFSLILCTVLPLSSLSQGMLTYTHKLVEFGNDLYLKGDLQNAATAYEKAAEHAPESAEIQFNRGNIFFRQFLFEDALEYYNYASQTPDQVFASKVKYNLGNVKYRQAITSMLSFQDAATPLQAAMGYYRESLAANPNNADARYNLELAQKLTLALRQQNVVGQNNPELRNQQTSDNAGQFSERAQSTSQTDLQQDLHQDQTGEQTPSQGSQGKKAAADKASTQNNTQLQQQGDTQEMTAEEAAQVVEMMRERAQSGERQRLQSRLNQMRDSEVEKYW